MAECIKCKKSYGYGKKYCITCGAKLIESEDILEEAKKLFEAKKYNSALNLIEEIPTFSSFKENADFIKIKIFSKTNNYSEIEPLLKKNTFAEFPKESKKELGSIYYKIGKMYFDNNKLDSAIELLQKSFDFENDNAKSLLAQLYFTQSKKKLNTRTLNESLDLIKKAIVLQPENKIYTEFYNKLQKTQKAKEKKTKIIIFSVSTIIILAILSPVIYNNFFISKITQKNSYPIFIENLLKNKNYKYANVLALDLNEDGQKDFSITNNDSVRVYVYNNSNYHLVLKAWSKGNHPKIHDSKTNGYYDLEISWVFRQSSGDVFYKYNGHFYEEYGSKNEYIGFPEGR